MDVLNCSLLLEFFDFAPEVYWKLVLSGDGIDTLWQSICLKKSSVLVVINCCLLFLPVELNLQQSSKFLLHSSDVRRNDVPEFGLDLVVCVDLTEHGL